MNVFGKEKSRNNVESCKKIAFLVKKLLCLDGMTTILMNLINDSNYEAFFSCMKYLPENEHLKFEFENLFKTILKFNNLLKIENETVVESINLANRIVFCRDFLFSTLLNESQLEELNSTVFLNNIFILKYITELIPTKFVDLMLFFEKNTNEMQSFFSELMLLLKSSNEICKTKFLKDFMSNGLLKRIVHLLEEKLEARDFTVTQSCFEIICFFTVNLPESLIEILNFKTNENSKSFLQKIPLFFNLLYPNFSRFLLEMFEIPFMIQLNGNYCAFIQETALPFFSEILKQNKYELSRKSLNSFFNFVAKLHLYYFKIRRADFIERVMAVNIFEDFSNQSEFIRNKFWALSFFQYFSSLLHFFKFRVDLEEKEFICPRSFELFTQILDSHCSQKRGLLWNLTLNLTRTVSELKNDKIRMSFVDSVRNSRSRLKEEGILLKIERDNKMLFPSKIFPEFTEILSSTIKESSFKDVKKPKEEQSNAGVVVKEFSIDALEHMTKKLQPSNQNSEQNDKIVKLSTSKKIDIGNIIGSLQTIKILSNQMKNKHFSQWTSKTSKETFAIPITHFETELKDLLGKRESFN